MSKCSISWKKPKTGNLNLLSNNSQIWTEKARILGIWIKAGNDNELFVRMVNDNWRRSLII